MHRIHPQRKGGVTNTTLQSQTDLPPQTPTPLNNGSHTGSFTFRPSNIMRRPLPDSDLDDFEPLPDVADLFDDPLEGVARQASKRERDSGLSGKTRAGSGSTMALTSTTVTTTAKRARFSARNEPTAVQTWQERHDESTPSQTQYSFDDDDIDFGLDMLSRGDDHHTPAIAANNSPAQATDRSYSTMLNEAVQQVDDILMGGGYDPFDSGNSMRTSSALSQAPTGFHAPLETLGEQQEHGNGRSNECLSDALSGHNKEDDSVRDQTGDNAHGTGTEHPIQGTEDQLTDEATGEVAHDPPAPVYSFTTPTSVNQLEERLRGECSAWDEVGGV
ncbi:hypothetical protein BGZ93_006876 [Podila epicladia]|nr:hypothetical protein BGZ93_006876 [Podila epicladia]